MGFFVILGKMKILLIDNGSGLLNKLKEIIPGDEIVLRPDTISPEDSVSFDLIILSGSKDLTVVYDSEHFKKEVELIKQTKTPIIGVCFGCEIIAVTFGGSLRRMDERHSGIRKIKSVSNNEIIGTKDGEIVNVYEGHRWIIDKVPNDFEVLATSEDGPEIIFHKNRPICGLQFHPENFVDQTAGDEIFLKLLSKITTDNIK